jgi:hypothetical protein
MNHSVNINLRSKHGKRKLVASYAWETLSIGHPYKLLTGERVVEESEEDRSATYGRYILKKSQRHQSRVIGRDYYCCKLKKSISKRVDLLTRRYPFGRFASVGYSKAAQTGNSLTLIRHLFPCIFVALAFVLVANGA